MRTNSRKSNPNPVGTLNYHEKRPWKRKYKQQAKTSKNELLKPRSTRDFAGESKRSFKKIRFLSAICVYEREKFFTFSKENGTKTTLAACEKTRCVVFQTYLIAEMNILCKTFLVAHISFANLVTTNIFPRKNHNGKRNAHRWRRYCRSVPWQHK